MGSIDLVSEAEVLLPHIIQATFYLKYRVQTKPPTTP
jgi:hypothetical protein